MTFSISDFPHIKWSVLFFLLALGAGGAALIFSEIHSARALQRQKAAQRQISEARHLMGEARSRRTAAQDDQANMAAYAQEYAALLDRKIIGSEPRLDWIEGMDKIRKEGLVLDFKYTIAPQRPYTHPLPLDSGNFDLNRSEMTLHFDLLHEGQLMNFFDALRATVKGRFILERCAVTRAGAAPENGSAPQLTAECSGGWLTLQNRGAK